MTRSRSEVSAVSLWWRWILYGTALSILHLLAFVTCIAFEHLSFLLPVLGMPLLLLDQELSRHTLQELSRQLPQPLSAAHTLFRESQELAFFGNSSIWGFTLAALALFWIQQRHRSRQNHDNAAS